MKYDIIHALPYSKRKSLLGQLAVDIEFASSLLGYRKSWRAKKKKKNRETHEIKKPRMRNRERNWLIMPRFLPTFNYYFPVSPEYFSFML